MKYTVVIERTHNNYVAYVPDLPGCVATAGTCEGVLKEIPKPSSSTSKACRKTANPYRSLGPRRQSWMLWLPQRGERLLRSCRRKTVTVDELIQLLANYPPDLRVMVQGYEDGFDDLEVGCVVQGAASLDVHSAWYYGRHEEAPISDGQTGRETVRALFIRRPWHDDGE